MKRSAYLLALILATALPLFPRQHQHGHTPAADGQFNPAVVGDRRGGFYLVYVERKGGRSDVMLRHSPDGKTFSKPVRVNDVPGDATVRNENPPKVAMAPDGNLYVCWANERAKWKGNVRFARSTDGGKTFAPAVTVNSDGLAGPAGHAFQSLAVDQRGRIYVAWIDERNKKEGDHGAEIWLSTSDDGGRTFAPDRRVISDVCECCRSGLLLDQAGRLFISYRTVPREGPMYRDIAVAHSTDSEKSFQTTVVSHDGWEINACPVAGPGLALDAQGRLAVVWFTGGGNSPGLFYSASADHGVTFAPRRGLGSAAGLGKHAQVMSLGAEVALVAWDVTGGAGAKEPRTYWGVLRPQSGRLEVLGQGDGVTYPVVAVSGPRALVAGLQAAKGEIFWRTVPLN